MKRRIISRQKMQEIERIAYEKYSIPPLILMENAGRHTAVEAARLVHNKKLPVVVVAGKGNNGGDGFVAARHLAIMGYRVTVYLAHPQQDEEKPAFTNLRILVKMNFSIRSTEDSEFANSLGNAGLVIDALFGIGLAGELGERDCSIIEKINASSKRVLSVDIPSGLDADTGRAMPVAVRATETITFGFAKKGLFSNEGKQYAGKIKVVDIGFPVDLVL